LKREVRKGSRVIQRLHGLPLNRRKFRDPRKESRPFNVELKIAEERGMVGSSQEKTKKNQEMRLDAVNRVTESCDTLRTGREFNCSQA